MIACFIHLRLSIMFQSPTLNECVHSVTLSDRNFTGGDPMGEGTCDTVGDGAGVRNMPRGTGKLRSMVITCLPLDAVETK